MKKSILVAPALAVLLLGAAGSVGGTVAWFSASSSAQLDASQFKATVLDGDLQVDVYGGKGTVANNTTKIVTVGKADEGHTMAANGAGLTHASFDHNNSKVYTLSSDTVSGLRPVTSATNWEAKSTSVNTAAQEEPDAYEDTKVYWAVSWRMVFTYQFALESKVNLFLDNSETNGSTVSSVLSASDKAAAKTAAQTTSGLDTLKSFRIAFVPTKSISESAEFGLAAASGEGAKQTTTGSFVNNRIWADNQTASACRYINDTNALAAENKTYSTTGSEYGSNEVIGSDKVAARPAEGVPISLTTETNRVVYQLGQFSNSNGTVSTAKLDITCVAWFEGTDPNTVSAAYLDTVVANMKFYTREYAA